MPHDVWYEAFELLHKESTRTGADFEKLISEKYPIFMLPVYPSGRTGQRERAVKECTE
jgi:hypothetical protein